MYYIWQHIDKILSVYKGETPLTHFLKHYFKKNPLLGSRDRKILSEMAYCYFRSAKSIAHIGLSLEDKIGYSLLLSSSQLKAAQKLLAPQIQQLFESNNNNEDLNSKLPIKNLRLEALFDGEPYLSAGIKKEEWLSSILNRPKLFIRVTDKYYSVVTQQINTENIAFEIINKNCLAFENGTALEKILKPAWYRIQDASSQQTSDYFNLHDGDRCWDCCCGAGGKSLLAVEKAKIHLCVSDVRQTILNNLTDRFKLYSYQLPECIQLSAADAVDCKQKLANRQFDYIIADVPCSGSGTWARTPEQLYFFDSKEIALFVEKQLAIASNALNYLKKGGHFLYVTCSVFAAENEQVVAQLLQQNKNIKLQEQKLINGIKHCADNMFVAKLYKEG